MRPPAGFWGPRCSARRLGVSPLTGALSFFRRHQLAILRVGGGLLVAFGLLLFFNRVYIISSWIQPGMDAAGLEELIEI